MSAGQRKCIAVARAFYGAPSLIVMDEPIPHLDSVLQKALISGIEQLRTSGTIFVLTTQRKSLAKVADKVILLREQKCMVLETRDEIAALNRGSRNTNARGGTKDNNKRHQNLDKRNKLRSV